MNDLKEWLKLELATNREYYKNVIKLLRWTRDQQLIKEVMDDELIMQGYEIALKDTLLDYIAEHYTDIHFEELWVALEDLELVTFFEPLN